MQAEAAAPSSGDAQQGGLAVQVRRAQLEQIYGQYINAVIGQPLAGIVSAYMLLSVMPAEQVWRWFGIFILLQMGRYLYSRQFHRAARPLNAQQLRFWSRGHVVASALSAAMWGICALVLWPESEFHQVALLFVIVITVAAALVGHASHKGSYIAYTVFALVPVGLRFMADGQESHTILGIGCFLAVAMLLRITERTNKANLEALVIGIRFREQAAMLSEAKGKTETLNQQLVAQTQALQESEARFRGLSDLTFEGIAIHDSGRILDANQAALDLLGYEESDIDGMHIKDLVSPEYLEIAAGHIQTDYDKPYEITVQRKDGTVLPVEVQGKTVPYEDGLVRVVAVRDISARKELEQQALELKLEQARLDMLTNFFQDASHEFRTPLSIISTKAYLIERVDTSQQHRAALDEINQQIERITNLVDDLTFLMKVDTDTELRRSATNINILLENAVESLGAAFSKKQHRLNWELDAHLPQLEADATLLQKSFYAILQNAERYTPAGGSITIRSACEDGQICIEIEDDGIGIDEYALNHVFNRFYRVDEAHSTAGFGIGLSIARSIVELHQGSISVQSQPDAGSTFTVHLPLVSP